MAASALGERIRELALNLSGEAVQALKSLPLDHAFELLDQVDYKVSGGHIKNPSNYVCATVSRGYVPQAEGGAMTASIARAGAAPGEGPQGQHAIGQPPLPGHPVAGQSSFVMAPRKRGFDSGPPAAFEMDGDYTHFTTRGMDEAADRLGATRGMRRVQEAGLSLSDEAVQALMHLQAEHASELLETVADKHNTLRDPSNYIVATVARGFVPRAGQLALAAANSGAPGGGGPSIRPAHHFVMSSVMSLVPGDLTTVESRVLELNAQDLWNGQAINVETLLALRCIDQDQALQLLLSLEAKGRGKGKQINSPNNYVQAAVVKIKKGLAEQSSAGPASSSSPIVPVPRHMGQEAPAMSKGGWNTTGNQSRQRARSLGLELDETSYSMLARVSLKDANWLLESASYAQQQEDPNDYIQTEARRMMAGEAGPSKRMRWV
uniref:Uncharacterized protein n=1 Tax=Alexandrium monilatum TaxID=311494 RepID=A0A7S4RER9_9DINO|mmetsp:Transcript_34214/g.102173  ORF Transcript_34214/g.102173 Transcript_34214/m.102173 type:complete len:435 (+) Transcript_34214:63-1367(+)